MGARWVNRPMRLVPQRLPDGGCGLDRDRQPLLCRRDGRVVRSPRARLLNLLLLNRCLDSRALGPNRSMRAAAPVVRPEPTTHVHPPDLGVYAGTQHGGWSLEHREPLEWPGASHYSRPIDRYGSPGATTSNLPVTGDESTYHSRLNRYDDSITQHRLAVGVNDEGEERAAL